MSSPLGTAILGESGLISYHPMDDAAVGTARDLGSYSLTGSYDPDCLLGVVGLNGQPGGAVKFGEPQNLGQQLNFPYNAAQVVTSTTSVEFCIRFSHFDFVGGFVFDVHGYSGPQVFWVAVGSGVGFQLKKHSASIMATTVNGQITDTYKWHHVVITWDGTTAHIWIDGVDTAGATTAQTFAAGSTAGGQWGGAYLKAAMCHGAYYNVALSPSQVAAHYAAFLSEVDWPTAPIKVGLHSGVSISASDGQRLAQLQAIRQAHATVTRTDFRWDLIQTSSGGAYNWSLYDTVVAETVGAGLSTMVFTISQSPTWANGGAGITWVPGASYSDGPFIAWVAAYQTFITAALARYRPGGAGNPTGLEIYWEIWNEPNSAIFWTSALSPQTNGAMYATLYQALRTSILAIDASAKVVFGGMTGWFNVTTGWTTGEKFLKDAFALSGIAINYASFHPYTTATVGPDNTSNSSNLLSDILSFRDTLCSYGFGAAKILITEFGWSSDVSIGVGTNQAAYLSTALARIRDYWSGFVTIAVVYRDWDKSDSFGIFSTMPSLPTLPAPKPSAASFEVVAARFDLEETWHHVLI